MEEEVLQISFSGLIKVIKKEIWWLIGGVLLFGSLGLVYALSLKDEFISEGKILPEVQGKSGGFGSLSGLAALAGVDLGSGATSTDAVRPDLYPDVLKSDEFFLSLYKLDLLDKNNKKINFKQYLRTTFFPKGIKAENDKPKFLDSRSYLVNSLQSEKEIKLLKSRINCSYDRKTGIIVISAKMQDPVIAAQLCRYGMDYLTEYITEYRTQKLRKDVDYFAERLNIAKSKYYSNQERKATYGDKLPLGALRLQGADIQRERIDAEYKTSATFYNTLMQKYEEAKLKLQQETPILKILNVPSVPNLKSEPKRSIILLGFLIAGCFLNLISVLIKSKNYKQVFVK